MEINKIIDKMHSLSLNIQENENHSEISQLYSQLMKLNTTSNTFDRTKLEDLLKQKFFYMPSFSIYGGVQGFYDYGPIGCATQANILSLWRKHFILEERMLEVDCSIITPEPVLKASGHVDRFSDYMVKDKVTGACYRADHLIKHFMENEMGTTTSDSQKQKISNILNLIDGFSAEEMNAIIKEFDIRSPTNANPLSELMPFNLMFSTAIGPSGSVKGYLRPETAQGIFVNFDSLLRFNQNNIPFAAAQIGKSFRNEISPRSGLIRVREFTMAEIEHFVDPLDKSHPKFSSVSSLNLPLFPVSSQIAGDQPATFTLAEAVKSKMIANETLGYYIGRIYLFLLSVGIEEQKLRFRQHLPNEMAHYACDCWDAECLTSFGWIECVGCADRSCYDLRQHTAATKNNLVASRHYDEPIIKNILKCVPDPKAVRSVHASKANDVVKCLKKLSHIEAQHLSCELSSKNIAHIAFEGSTVEVTSDMVHFDETTEKVVVEDYIPTVIEPSFGIGRVLYSIFEHNFSCREGSDTRTYIALPAKISPYKCAVFCLVKNKDLLSVVTDVENSLRALGVAFRVDNSGTSIGKRYVRNDQLSVPYTVTVDFETLKDETVTLRDRDSMLQIRVAVGEVAQLVASLSSCGPDCLSWADVIQKYPLFRSNS